MLSMLLNSSTPILYYNKDVFEAGLDLEQPPETWAQMEEFSATMESGARNVASPPAG